MRRLYPVLIFFFLCGPAHAVNHPFTGLPLDSNGWTDFSAITASGYGSSRVIFVSASGNDGSALDYTINDVTFDSNGMFQPTTAIMPYGTVTAAMARLRDGYPDILLFKRGETWEGEVIGYIGASGASAQARLIIASYGTGDRPRFVLPTDSNGANLGYNRSYIIMAGLYFEGNGSEQSGWTIKSGVSHDILVEDCVAYRAHENNVQGYLGFNERIAYRRNLFYNGMTGTLTANVYAFQVDDLLIEENIFNNAIDQNRFLYMSPAAIGSDGVTPNNALTGLIVRGNIFDTSRRTGLSVRSGGLIENNLILRNDIILHGGGGGSEDSIQSGVIRHNVILESIPGSAGDGEWGINIQNNDGTSVYGNIVADGTNLTNSNFAILLKGDVSVFVARNLDIYDNIVYNRASATGSGTPFQASATLNDVYNVKIHDNDFQLNNGCTTILMHPDTLGFSEFSYYNNRYYSSTPQTAWFSQGDLNAWVASSNETGAQAVQVQYSDPNRNVKTYNQSLGGSADIDAFMAEAMLQSRQNWRTAYKAESVNNYVRAGFDMDPVYLDYSGASPITITCYLDADGDGYSDGTSETVETCSANYYTSAQLTATSGDCNDSNAAINPAATEICGNGIDEDCSGADLACAQPDGEVYLSDSFESGNLSSPSGTTGSWGNSNTGPGDSVVVSSDRARTGTKSLKFTYSGNADVCDDASAEQRFNIGQSVNEAYVGYYIYFPSNYAHRTPSGCSSNANNNKVFRIWSENADYTGDPIKMGASFSASSVSRLFPEAMKSWVNNAWEIDCNGSMGDVNSVGTLGSWTLTANELNKWLHFEFHVKVDEGTGNAAMEFWVDGDLKYSDLTLDYSNSPCVRNYFKTGYLMGWANSGFTQDTSIYIDDVVVASEYIGTSSPSTVTCYKDGDDDGFGPEPIDSITATSCSAPYYLSTHFVSITGDCNDSSASINPGATEICGNGIDEDCSGADAVCTPSGLIVKPGRIYNIRGAGEIYSAHGAK